ncbi:MAG: substrate-binding domain-containing protein [Methylobacteriaceae bacterium]|nr:substrate-binding domain-containing protein [Methylobacteriaceae bacterium]
MATHRTWTRGLGVGMAALALAALGGNTVAAQEKPTVYVIAPSLTDPFWITEQNGAKQAGQDFGVNVAFEAPAQDTGDAAMVPLIQAAIAAKPAGIAIDYTSKTMEAATVAALDAGIPVVLYNNNRFEGPNAPGDKRILGLSFVGQDESMSGETLTKAWLASLPAKPCKVLIVNPFPTAFVLTLRGDGVKRALDAVHYPHDDLAATGDEGQNLSLISAALQADTGICGIVGLGNPAANPAAKYVGENGLKIPVATFDVGAEAAKRIKDGTLTMAINQQPFLQSYFAVANMVNQAKYSLSPVNINTGTSIVTTRNIGVVQACIDAGRC